MNDARVSVVICVRNSLAMLQRCLPSVIAEQPYELIVVDGQSSDGSAAFARRAGAKVISDDGLGIAHARGLGVKAATGDYILFIGPDNVIEKDFISQMQQELVKWGFKAAAPQTRVLAPATFWDRGMDFHFRSITGIPGPKEVVGTPTMYDASVFREVSYNESAGACDDTDVSEQIRKKGYQIGVVPVIAYDQNGADRAATWRRFAFYGKGDALFYGMRRDEWTLPRKVKSLTHPLRQALRHGFGALARGRVDLLPFLLFAMTARYTAWVRQAYDLRA